MREIDVERVIDEVIADDLGDACSERVLVFWGV